jgi:hypothetical protein
VGTLLSTKKAGRVFAEMIFWFQGGVGTVFKLEIKTCASLRSSSPSLLQIEGSKVMTQFPAGDPRFAPDTVHESYHSGGARELTWRDEFADHGTELAITAGQALFVPVMAPHFVRNGPISSISLSITWRSDWSFEEADARGLNRLLRKAGVSPNAPQRWPASNKAKAYAYRALRKLRLTR